MNDKELLERIRVEPEAFGEFFKLYYKQIFGYILRRTASFDDSADIAADSFYKAYRHINNFRYTGISVKVWLYRIATNEVNLYFRNKQKHSSIFDRLNLEDNKLFSDYMEDDRREVEAEIQKHEQFLSVLNELRRLPMKYQEVISLKYFEGKENGEIAEILNVKEGTLKSLLSRGLEKLRIKCNQI